MATKKKTPATAPAENATAQTTEPQPVTTRAKRQAVVMQPELATEFENCKKRMTSIKAINKLAPIIGGMDHDALDMVGKLVGARRNALVEAQ